MRRWQLVTGWVMAVALASAVGFVAIALVGVGLDPLSRSSSSSSGSIGALGADGATASPGGRPETAGGQLPVVTPGSVKPPVGAGAAGSPDDSNDSLGDSVPAASEPPTASTRPRATTTPSGSTTITRSVSTVGGSATARCTGSRIVLSAWSPAPGYSVDEVKAGPATSVEVRFTSSSREVEIKAECSKGVPRFETESRSDSESDDD